MGKGAQAGGAQAKAEPKRRAEAKAASAPEKESREPGKAGAKAPAAEGAAKAPEGAGLAEEARQKWADDDRDERVRVELRDQNRQARASGWQLTGNRDKSIARVTRFQNRLKLFKGDTELAGVVKDIDGVDASKYVSELAECIMEAAGVNVKLKELVAVVKVCCRLHATYEDFSGFLAKALERAYAATPATDLNRRRFLLRMCAELCLVECVQERSPLLGMVRELTDISLPEEQLVTNFTIVSSLAQKHAPSCLNIVPGKQKAYEEALGKAWVERRCLLKEPLRVQLGQLVVNAYQSCAAGLLQAAHSRLLEQEKLHTKLRVDKGQVDAENEQKHQQIKEGLAKLQLNLATLSECLNQPMPVAREEDPSVSRIEGRREAKEDAQEEDLQMIWEDTEQQRFYEEVLDPRDVIPAVLLGGGKAPAAEAPEEAAGAGEQKEAQKPEAQKPEAQRPEAPGEQKEETRAEARAQMASDFELYLARLAKAESAKQVDDIVVEFFHDFNTKGNRRLLAQQLLAVQRTKLHLLAPHSRLIAVVAPYLKEVPSTVLSGLQYELEQLLAEKDPIAIESKVRTVRYLCELCKFRVCPPGVILDTFKSFCDDFSQHHAELCAHLLQCCGRFLLYTPETAMRTENLLERMMRLKNAKSLPLRLEVMLEDSYYQVKPPESKRKKAKDKDPLELFIQSLIFERMHREDDEDKVLKLVRKLPWDSPTQEWVRKSLLDLNMHANYESLYLIASLLSGLAKYRDAFVIGVIDTLFENIQATLERNDFREMPLRVRQAKLLGELYNYRLVDSGLIFDALYQLIGLSGPTAHRAGQAATAHRVLERALAARRGGLGPLPEESEDAGAGALPAVLADPQHPLEAPWDYFRIKLVCVLLETCGHYFDHGADRLKLDRFLHFFARYVRTKGDLPLRFMNMVHDTLERLRPKLALPSKAAADEAVLKLLQAERETLDLGEERAAGREEDAGDEDSTEDEESGSEDEETSNEDEDSEEEESDSEEEDDGAYDRGEGPASKHREELQEFDREVQQLLIESLEREKHAPRALAELPAPPPPSKRPEGGEPGTFSLLQKRGGGKMLVKQIDIPDDSKLMRVVRASQGEATKEQEDLKKYIMQSVQNPLQAVGGSSGSGGGRHMSDSGIRMRAGKGGHKGGYHAERQRRNAEYVRDEFLPEEDRGEPAAQNPAPAPRRGGKGGGAGHASWGGRGGGGAGGGWAGGGGGRPRDWRGTPSSAGARGAL